MDIREAIAWGKGFVEEVSYIHKAEGIPPSRPAEAIAALVAAAESTLEAKYLVHYGDDIPSRSICGLDVWCARQHRAISPEIHDVTCPDCRNIYDKSGKAKEILEESPTDPEHCETCRHWGEPNKVGSAECKKAHQHTITPPYWHCGLHAPQDAQKGKE